MWVVWGWKWVVKLFGWLVVGSLTKSVLFMLILMWLIRNPSNRLQRNQRQLLYINSTNNCRLFILNICRFSLTDDLLGWRYPCFQISRWIVDSFRRRWFWTLHGDKGLNRRVEKLVAVGKSQISKMGRYQYDCMTVYLPNMSNYSAHHAHEQVIWHQNLIALEQQFFWCCRPNPLPIATVTICPRLVRPIW